jgi:hypothetical protein
LHEQKYQQQSQRALKAKKAQEKSKIPAGSCIVIGLQISITKFLKILMLVIFPQDNGGEPL